MQHDIYSLGVCLLEIVLWISFVIRTNPSKSPIPCPELEITDLLGQSNHEKRAVGWQPAERVCGRKHAGGSMLAALAIFCLIEKKIAESHWDS